MWGTKLPAVLASLHCLDWMHISNFGCQKVFIFKFLFGCLGEVAAHDYSRFVPKKATDAAKSFKTNMGKTQQQHRSWKKSALVTVVVRSAGRHQLGNKLTTGTGWEGGVGGWDKWLRKLQITSKSSKKCQTQNERSKQKAGEEEKIIGRESSRCVSGCSPATTSRQEHHFQFLSSSQQTVILWHISPLSGLSFFPPVPFGCCPSLTGLTEWSKTSH